MYVADRNNHRIQKVDLNSKIVIKAGSMSSNIKFTSISDYSYENDETIIVNPSVSTINATNNFNDPYNIKIIDQSDLPLVSFKLSSETIDENSSNDVIFTASILYEAGQPIQIPFEVSGTATIDDEYTLSANSIKIIEGAKEGSISISTKI